MTVEEMKRIKKEKGYTYQQIAEHTGVPLGTVQKVFCGETRSPRYDTLSALERFFSESSQEGTYVREAASYMSGTPWKRQGGYTIEDYYALPDDRRVELIDGIIYDMSSPTFVHQRVVGEVYRQVSNFIFENQGACIPMTAPVDVRLDCDDRTMVQPDMLILCDRDKVESWGIMGAPDFVLEVLSPSTRRKDCLKKMVKYMEAGVKEYWIVDPEKEKLIVYQFEEEAYPAVYGLDQKVPMKLFDDRLVIDLDIIRGFIQESRR